MLLLTLRGTPTIYMGDELGMLDTPIGQDEVRDPAELREPGSGRGRDPVRTPFPWTDGPGRGFTSGTPWLPNGLDAPLDSQRNDAGSFVELYRRLIALRRDSPALSAGTIEAVQAEGPVLSYERMHHGMRLRIVLNLAGAPAHGRGSGKVLASTRGDREGDSLRGGWDLRPDEGLVLRVE
jgi:alpha-glucosidase